MLEYQIEWNDDFKIGIELIDEQHIQLISYFNDTAALVHNGYTKETVITVLETLVLYTIEHFTSEEQLMKTHKFPEIDSHIAEHTAFFQKTHEFVRRLTHKNEVDFLPDLVMFLSTWITNHIKNVDIKLRIYGNYYEGK